MYIYISTYVCKASAGKINLESSIWLKIHMKIKVTKGQFKDEEKVCCHFGWVII